MAKLKFKDEDGEFIPVVQDVLVNNDSVFDGKNANIELKTINSQSITGSGNIEISPSAKVDILLSTTPDQEGFYHSKYTPAELWDMYNDEETFLTIDGQLIANATYDNGEFSCALLFAKEVWTPIYVTMYVVRPNDDNKLRKLSNMPAASADFTINGHKLSDNMGVMTLAPEDLAYVNTIKGTAVTTAKGALDTLTTNVNALSTVEANPTLAGTESDLTALEVAGTKYKIPSGGGGGGNTTTIQTSWSTMPQNPNVGDRVTNVNDNSGTPGGGGFAPVIDVTAPIGTSITVSNGSIGFTRTSTEEVTRFDIPEWDTWTVNAMIGSLVDTETVEVDTVKIYKVAFETVPSGYQEVAWVGSSGTQYIDLGLNFANNMRAVFKDIEFGTSSTGSNYCFGMYWNTDDSSGAEKFAIAGPNTNHSTARFYYGFGTGSNYNFGFSVASDTSYEIDFCDKNGDQYGKVDNVTAFTDSKTVTGRNIHLYLFGLYSRFGGGTMQTYYGHCKIHKFRLYQGDTLVRNLIACYRTSDNVIGLYDMVNNHFYTNNGTGSFTKGGDV